MCVLEIHKKVNRLSHQMGGNIFKMKNANELITSIYKELLKSKRIIRLIQKWAQGLNITEETYEKVTPLVIMKMQNKTTNSRSFSLFFWPHLMTGKSERGE